MTEARDGQAIHQQVWELLAWYVNGSATPAQRRIVEDHLPHCDACRAEHDTQRQLCELLRRDAAEAPDPAPGLARLMADLDRPAAPAKADATPQLLRSVSRRMKFAVAALAALALLETATLATLSMKRADYQTLSSAQPDSVATIRMVPSPTMSVSELDGHLRRLGLQVVAGPTEAGVYSLAPAGRTDTAAALAALRATPGVLFAEPVGEAR